MDAQSETEPIVVKKQKTSKFSSQEKTRQQQQQSHDADEEAEDDDFAFASNWDDSTATQGAKEQTAAASAPIEDGDDDDEQAENDKPLPSGAIQSNGLSQAQKAQLLQQIQKKQLTLEQAMDLACSSAEVHTQTSPSHFYVLELFVCGCYACSFLSFVLVALPLFLFSAFAHCSLSQRKTRQSSTTRIRVSW